MEANQMQPGARHQCGEALQELQGRHDDVGGAVAVGAFELQHHLAGAVAGKPLVGNRVAGYGLRKLEYDLAPFVIAFVLAPLLEQSLRQSLVMSPDGAMILVERPATTALLAASAVLVGLMLRRKRQPE